MQRRWFAGQFLVFLLYLPWLKQTFLSVRRIRTHDTILNCPLWQDIPGCFKAFSGDNAWIGLFFILLACLSIRSLFGDNGTKDDQSKIRMGVLSIDRERLGIYFLLSLFLLVPILLPFAFSRVMSPIFSSRYTIAASYPFYMMAAEGIVGIRKKWLRKGFMVLALSLFLITLLPRYFQANNEQWREATNYLETHRRPGGCLLFHPRFCWSTGYLYYAENPDFPWIGFPMNAFANPQISHSVTQEGLQDLLPLLEPYDRIWLILSHSRDKNNLIAGELRKTCLQKEYLSFVKIEIYLFEKQEF